MFWRSPKTRKDREDSNGSDLTIGQRFDLGDTAVEVLSRGFGGSKNPLNWMTATLAAADVSISSGTAKRGNMAGAGVSAAAAQAAGLTGYAVGATVGETVGEVIGTFLLPGIGTVVGGAVGGVIGGGVGSLTGDRVARTNTQHLFNGVNATRPRVNFGTFKDSQPVYTMRQRAEAELSVSLLNARRYMGREAQLMHQ